MNEDERNLPNTFKKKKANHIHHLQYLKELKNKRCNNQVISNSISVINSIVSIDKKKKKINRKALFII